MERFIFVAFPGGPFRPAFMPVAAMALVFLFISGCSEIKEPDKGANQSLVEIGEYSLEDAEELESLSRKAEANAAYKRALWAFRYHEQLTGEEPLLLDDAIDGIRRTNTRKQVERKE